MTGTAAALFDVDGGPVRPAAARQPRGARAGRAAHSSSRAWTNAWGRLPRCWCCAMSYSSENSPADPHSPGWPRTSGPPRRRRPAGARRGPSGSRTARTPPPPRPGALVVPEAVDVVAVGQLVAAGAQGGGRARVVRGRAAPDRRQQQGEIGRRVAGGALPPARGVQGMPGGVSHQPVRQRAPGRGGPVRPPSRCSARTPAAAAPAWPTRPAPWWRACWTRPPSCRTERHPPAQPRDGYTATGRADARSGREGPGRNPRGGPR